MEGGKLTAKQATDRWVNGSPEILRGVFRVTITPSSNGGLQVTIVEHTVMRAGGEKKDTVITAELAPDATPKEDWFAFMTDESHIDAALAAARKSNLEHEATNAKSGEKK
jgi:hypothetical protein